MFAKPHLWKLDPHSIHTDAPTTYILQGDTHLRTQIKPSEQVPLTEKVEAGNGGGLRSRGGKTNRRAWHGLMALFYEPSI